MQISFHPLPKLLLAEVAAAVHQTQVSEWHAGRSILVQMRTLTSTVLHTGKKGFQKGNDFLKAKQVTKAESVHFFLLIISWQHVHPSLLPWSPQITKQLECESRK